MKLQQLLPQTGIPAAAPYPSVSGDALAAPATAAARGFAGLQRQALVALGAIRREEETRKALEIRTDAAVTQALVEVELDDLDQSLRATITDPDEYLAARNEGARTIVEGLADRVKHPETLTLLQAKIPRVLGTREIAAKQHARGLFVGQRKAALTTGLDAFTRVAGSTPIGDEQEFARIYADAQGLIDEFEPLLGPEAAAQQRIKTREALFDERARRDSQEDPAGFLQREASGKYRGMDPNKRDTYVNAAGLKVAAMEKDEAARFERFLVGVEREADQEREARLMTLSEKATAGTLTVADVQRERSYSTFKTREELEHYLKLATVEAKREREESDPETYFRLAEGVRQVHPTTSRASLNKALQTGALVRKDWDALTKELLSRADAAKDERKADLLRQHGQGEQNFRLWLGVTPGMEGLRAHDERVTLLTEIFREYAARSAGMYGREDPKAVEAELFERYQPRRDRAFRMSLDATRAMLTYPSLDEVGLKGLLDQKKISPDVYRIEVQRLRRVRDAEARAAGAATALPTSKGQPGKK